jgi:hypothetical protein
MMLDVDVRRLAAIDMFGSRGTTRRRRVVVAEFVSGVIGTTALGIWLLASSSSLGGQALAVWVLGAGLNYAPLAVHAIALTRPGRLDAELAGVDTARELRRYGVLQLWIFMPLALVVFAIRDVVTRRA